MDRKDKVKQFRAFIRELAASRQCADCGADGRTTRLVWHHRSAETFVFHVAGGYARSEEALREEIEKCDPLCQSCHRKRHVAAAPQRLTHSHVARNVKDPVSGRRLSGPRSRYRGKVRTRPVVVTFTPEGHAALADGTRRTGLSRSDYVEMLLRRAHQIGRAPA